MNDNLLNIGLNGRKEVFTYPDENVVTYIPPIKGVNQLVDDYKWYLANGFEHEKVLVENDNKLMVDWNRYVI